MNFFVQYHNVEREGLPLTVPPFTETDLGIRTRRSHIKNARGRVFLIAGIGRPRRYFLWETFRIEEVQRFRGGKYVASGRGWQLAPPMELHGERFDAFRRACADFVSFRDITRLPYATTLHRLAEEKRASDLETRLAFLYGLRDSLVKDATACDTIDDALDHLLERQRVTRALSIRQPHAEAIMRGNKTVEYRSGPTNIRGRVYIYAAQTRYSADAEAEDMDEYGITDVTCDDLPRGVLVGTAELCDCDDGDWYICNPERAKRRLKPKNRPEPVWFNPF
jgi:hypothetical protein